METLSFLTKDIGTSGEKATNAQQDALNEALKVFNENALIDGCDVTLVKENGGFRGSWDINLYVGISSGWS